MEKSSSALDTISFEQLLDKSYEYLNQVQDSCKKNYDLDSYDEWYYDQYKGELTFIENGQNKLIIDYEEVGSVSFKSNSWLWSWDNPHVENKVKSEIVQVKSYGERRHFKKLTDAKWKADEIDGWEMTAIASYLLKAKGAYRVPLEDDKLYSFMIFKNIRWADTTTSEE